MAFHTDIRLRNKVIYCVYVRNHTPEGTFRALEGDLPRIRALGVDILWLMPIHPIGEACRKGTLGSPYAISDYRAVNPAYGTLEDFQHLVEQIHRHEMLCMIDVVFGHTSPDSWLCKRHPEWFYKTPEGGPGSRTADWTDVADLDYANTALWDHQVATLRQWAEIVDGFRCDVAAVVPVGLWELARREVDKVRPGCIWLAESVEPYFIVEKRAHGFTAHSDSELYRAFDICYDYDLVDWFTGAVAGKIPLSRYAEMIAHQEAIYPHNYVKLRYLENHDTPRGHALVPDGRLLRNWTAFQYLLKGTALIYAGQEVGAGHTPSLFERDPVEWSASLDLTPLLRELSALKHAPLLADGVFTVTADDAQGLACQRYRRGGQVMEGVFCLRGGGGRVPSILPDGAYRNELGGAPAVVRDGLLECGGEPVVVLGEGGGN